MANETANPEPKYTVGNLFSWVNQENQEIVTGLILDVSYPDNLLIVEISENDIRYLDASKYGGN